MVIPLLKRSAHMMNSQYAAYFGWLIPSNHVETLDSLQMDRILNCSLADPCQPCGVPNDLQAQEPLPQVLSMGIVPSNQCILSFVSRWSPQRQGKQRNTNLVLALPLWIWDLIQLMVCTLESKDATRWSIPLSIPPQKTLQERERESTCTLGGDTFWKWHLFYSKDDIITTH